MFTRLELKIPPKPLSTKGKWRTHNNPKRITKTEIEVCRKSDGNGWLARHPP